MYINVIKCHLNLGLSSQARLVSRRLAHLAGSSLKGSPERRDSLERHFERMADKTYTMLELGDPAEPQVSPYY